MKKKHKKKKEFGEVVRYKTENVTGLECEASLLDRYFSSVLLQGALYNASVEVNISAAVVSVDLAEGVPDRICVDL